MEYVVAVLCFMTGGSVCLGPRLVGHQVRVKIAVAVLSIVCGFKSECTELLVTKFNEEYQFVNVTDKNNSHIQTQQ